jgi:phospholipase/carboxylesterase
MGYSHQLARVGRPYETLRACIADEAWEPPYSAMRPLLDEAATYAIAGFEGLYEAAEPPEDLTKAFRALRNLPRALEALYPIAGIVPPVSRFFLDPPAREDGELQQRLFRQPPPENTGVLCLGEDPDARETVWAYVPESYDPATPAPVIFALHGGSGRGRNFMWAWVRAARTRGAILIAPTSLDQTWAIQGDDRDSPHLAQVLSFVQRTWSVDASRILLTGMSDGGTFTYTSGLVAGSPFTHLAPVAAAFHPMLAAMADGDRVRGLPVHILHGTRDWMFPFAMAEDAQKHLSGMGANVTYQRLDDLSHSYGPDLSTMIIDWFLA